MTGIAFTFSRLDGLADHGLDTETNRTVDSFLKNARDTLTANLPCDCEVVQDTGFAALGVKVFSGTKHNPVVDPILSSGGTYFYFHGRLDNRQELIGKLRAAKALSDAELTYQLLSQHGHSILQRLIGPFALALVQTEPRSVLLARDVLGNRPLFFHLGQESLVVASEAAGVLAHPAVGTAPSKAALAAYFSVIRPPVPGSTFFEQVQELAPGAAMIVDSDRVKTYRFRELDHKPRRFASDKEAVEQFSNVLQEAVSCRLPEGDPAAVLMSGGLDSTTVAAFAASAGGRAQLPLYASSWVFDELVECNERAYIEPVVEQLNLRWLPVTSDLLWPLGDFDHWPHDPNSPMDGPYRRLATASYAAIASQGCQVLLNGEFGDHLFTGWPHWLRDLVAEGRLLDASRELARELKINGLRGIRSPLAQLLSAGRWRRGAATSSEMPWLTAEAKALLASPFKSPVTARRADQWLSLTHPVNSMASNLEIRHAARHGIENRRPFRDLRVIEAALQMPAHLFYRPGQNKWLLRQLNRGRLPEKTRTRRWTSSLQPLMIRGLLEREATRVDDLLWSADRQWPAMIREDWMRSTLPKLRAGAPDGVAWVVLWLVVTFEIWCRHEASQPPAS